MFDSFAFSEVMVICVVALVVLGPKRLPAVVRKLGRWMGKARAMARDFRQQLENEVTLEELNRMTEKQSRRDPPPAGEPAPAASASGDSTATADSTTPAGSGSDAVTGSATSGDASTAPDAAPLPGDDTYSHAHAEGEAPMPWGPEAEPAVEPLAATAAPDSTPAPSPESASAPAPSLAEARPDPAPLADVPLDPDPAAPARSDPAHSDKAPS